MLVEPTADAQRSLLVLASQASNEQVVRMRELGSMALERWKEAGHAGWAVTEADSNNLLGELERFQVLCCAALCCAVLCCAVLSEDLVHSARPELFHCQNEGNSDAGCGEL